MKAIEINKKQKDMLLEMCKVLFSEYFYWKISKKQFIKSYIIGNDTEIYKGQTPSLNIHWFEFCMTYLSIAISKIKNYPADLIDRNEFAKSIIDEMYSQHPVDYLYEEFLKLKNN
jgi:hypothetical protein